MILPPLTDQEIRVLRRGLTAGVVAGAAAGWLAARLGLTVIGVIGVCVVACLAAAKAWINIEYWITHHGEED